LDIKKQLKILENQISRIEGKLKLKINKIATTENETIGFYSKMQRELKQDYEDLRKLFSSKLAKTLPIAYYDSLKENITRLKGLKFQGNRKIDYVQFIKSTSHKRIITSLINEGAQSFYMGLDRDYKSLTRLLNTTQQTLIKENKINKLIDEGFTETKSLYGATKKLRNELSKKAIDGKFVTVLDKNGKERRYEIKYYSEMVAQSKYLEAMNTATINTALEVGSDLVQMDNHNSECDICAPLEGKIYSISGNDKDFPVLDFNVPLHVHCYHGLTVIFRETLEHFGIQQYKDFANGDSTQMPYNKSYVPLSERKLA
jgi:hypothetical protein